VSVKILIADDDLLFRRVLYKVLAPEGDVSVVEDGTAAWATLQAMDGPTLAILDWVMPGMTGPEVCREARSNSKTAAIYLILVTSRNSAADIQAGLRSGADDYVTKPFVQEELRVRVRLGQTIVRLRQMVVNQTTALESSRAREITLQSRVVELEKTLAEKAPQSQASTPIPPEMLEVDPRNPSAIRDADQTMAFPAKVRAASSGQHR